MKHFGFLIPASNIVAEKELYSRLIADCYSDIYFHFARLKFQTPYGTDEEKYTQELVNSIPEAISELKRISLCNTAVLCTSAEIYYHEDDNLIFPLTAVISYLKKKNKSHPMIITPYNSCIGEKVTDRMKKAGIKIIKELHLDIKTKEELLLFSNEKLMKLIDKEITNEVDSICILCTNFATLHLENEIKNKFGIPLVSSNLAIYDKIISCNGGL